jgi:hypothetical protein
MRVGNVVTVSGQANATVTSGGTTTVLGLSLPIASTLSAESKLGGVGAAFVGDGTAATPIAIFADTSNNRATLKWTSATGTGADDIRFTFTYLIT